MATGDRPSDGPTLEAIAKRLLLTRQVVGLPQGEFAQGAGIAANTYNQYEQAKKRPSIENAIALCEAYDLTLDWIYRGENSCLPYKIGNAIKALLSARAST